MNPFEHVPVIAPGADKPLGTKLRRMRTQGLAWSPLPGVFAPADQPDDWQTRLLAAHLWAPGLTVVGAAAAKLLWWSECPVERIELWGAKRKSPAPWLTVSQACVDPDWIDWHSDIPAAAPALSAVLLAKELGGRAIDEALRRRAAGIAAMRAALAAIPNQEGNTALRRLLHLSRNEPWSELEREGHRLLDEAGITGWRANHRVVVRGEVFFVDLAFPGLRLAVEFDGYEFHAGRAAFEADRRRQNALVLAGWTVLRFTWTTLPELVSTVRRALRRAS